MNEQPQSDAPQDDPAAKRKRSDGGAFLAIGVTFFVLGLAQAAGDGEGWDVAYLGVGVMFMVLSSTMRSPSKGRGGDGSAAGDDGAGEGD